MQSQWRTRQTPQVCIIGAGFAGLRCADILLQANVDVTILEARDRVGGRVHQSKVLGHLADTGANWIHGTERNPILELAKATSTNASDIGGNAAIIDEHGARLDDAQSAQLRGAFWSIVEEAFKHSNQELPSIPASRSLKDFVAERLRESRLDEETQRLVLQVGASWGAYVGEPFDRQSLKWFLLEEVLDGENLFNASTYSKILERVAEPALSGATLRLSTTVDSVRTFETAAGTPQVTLATADCDAGTFDAVVLTVPLGCLKHSTPTIQPALPPRLTAAIDHLSFGRLEKAYLTFPHAFWDRDYQQRAAGLGAPFFTSFVHPRYAPLNPAGHNVECCSLTALPDPTTRHPTLLFYLYGPLSVALGEELALHSPGSDAYTAAVAAFFQPYFARLPGYDATQPECTPHAVLATAWHRDPLAGFGSYTNFLTPGPAGSGGPPAAAAADEVRLDDDVVALRRGLPERGLWLAGEHTAPFVALGTVTGAWWSGERVAARVAAWLRGEEDRGWEEGEGGEGGRARTVQVGKSVGPGSGSVEVADGQA